MAIVGAGPAGSTAAYHLATAGASVLLLDKATFPRDKPCGGGVTGRAARLLPFSIEPVVEDVVDRLECGLRYRHRFTRRARGPLAYMTQRRRLDHFLLQKAAEAGAEVREGETADARELDARIVIGADGCNGSSAKQLGLAEGVVHGVALEANYPYESALRRRDGARDRRHPRRLRLDLPEGRPRQRRRRRERGGGAEAARRAATDVRGVRDRPGRGAGDARLPAAACGCRGRGSRAGRTAVIGDAAGLVDPFSGDGMYEAFLSAKLVADAALEVLAGRAEDLDAYQAAVERRIAPLTRAGWGAKRAFERFPRTTYALARLPVTFRALEKLLQGDLPHPAAARGSRARRDPCDLCRLASRAALRATTRPGSRSAASA